MALMDIVVRTVTIKLKGLCGKSISDLITEAEAELYSAALTARTTMTAFDSTLTSTATKLTSTATAACGRFSSTSHEAPEIPKNSLRMSTAERLSVDRLSASVSATVKSLRLHDASTEVLRIFDVNWVYHLPANASIGSRLKGHFLPVCTAGLESAIP